MGDNDKSESVERVVDGSMTASRSKIEELCSVRGRRELNYRCHVMTYDQHVHRTQELQQGGCASCVVKITDFDIR
jgi:hypothetical protein